MDVTNTVTATLPLVKENESSVVGHKRNVRFRMREIADEQV